jgi:Holliday junction resolvasome RuvABC endonuclease subunit
MARILALDLATKTGYAYKGVDSVIYGVTDFSPGRMESYGVRYVKFENFLDSFKGRVDIVYFEEVKGHKSTYAAQLYGGFVAILTKWCEGKNIRYHTVSVSQIKKRATGNGGCNKDMVVKAAEKKWPAFKIVDDNVADALWILDLACGEGTNV